MDGVENAYYYKRMAVIDRGQPKVWPLIHHYDISALVLNTISEGKYCQTQTCEFLKGGDSDSSEEERFNAYLRLLAHASE